MAATECVVGGGNLEVQLARVQSREIKAFLDHVISHLYKQIPHNERTPNQTHIYETL